MKKKKDYTLLALFIPLVLAVVCNLPGCYSATPECPFEGAECPNAQAAMRDYQIQVTNDSLCLYDGFILVGTVAIEGTIGKTILGDNQ
jgi:hypothetical protein